MGLLLATVLAVSTVWASGGYAVESQTIAQRAEAEALAVKVTAAGIPAHLVRRFKLGRGWEFVLVVDGLATEAAATAAAGRMEAQFHLAPVVVRLDDGPKAAPAAPGKAAEEPAARTPADWIADAVRAHGGAAGGSARLGRSGTLHVVYARTAIVKDVEASIRHDYWRAESGRRLVVSTGGAAVDSVAVVSASGAWIATGGQVTSRDIGVLLEAVDAFAPEAVLTVALEVAPLLASPEVARFRFLEGAEGAVRLGSGADGPEPGLSYIDLDPRTGRLQRVRYVSEGGPIEWDLRAWKEVSPGVVVPLDVRIERADGRKERILIETFEVGGTPPAGTFDAPKG